MLENKEDMSVGKENLKTSPDYAEAWCSWSVWQWNCLLKPQRASSRKETRQPFQLLCPWSPILGEKESERNSHDPYWEKCL